MKQTYKVNIGGFAFSLEEEAYSKCSEYIDSLTRFYENEEDGQEIVDSIEQRIAELLIEKCGKDSIVNADAIVAIISILGTPEQVEEGSDAATATATSSKPSGKREKGQKRSSKFTYNEKRKLFRDPSKGILGGVCSGLSTYFNIDIVAVRLLFVIFTLLGVAFRWTWFGGFGFHIEKMVNMMIPVLYVILWIIMPAATTAKERWQLRGEDGSLDDIRREREIPREYNGSANRSQFWHVVFRVICVFAGIILMTTAISGIIGGLCAVAGVEWFGTIAIMEIVPYEIAPYLLSSSFSWLKFAAACCWFLPCIGMIYGSVMLIFGLKSPVWHPGLIIFLLWIIAIIATVSLAIIIGKNVATPLYYNGMAMIPAFVFIR